MAGRCRFWGAAVRPLTTAGSESRLSQHGRHKKTPRKGRGVWGTQAAARVRGPVQAGLLGSRSGTSGSVGSSLGSVCRSSGSRSVGGRGSSSGGSSVGGSSSRSGCGLRCGCGSSHRSRCRSGFFLLATGGESSSSDQGGQNERLVHFKVPKGGRQKSGEPRTPRLTKGRCETAPTTGAHPFWCSPRL